MYAPRHLAVPNDNDNLYSQKKMCNETDIQTDRQKSTIRQYRKEILRYTVKKHEKHSIQKS